MAHTYMAAEALKLSGEKLGMEVLIETQGGAGVENQLKQKDIDEAVCVVIADDVALAGMDRFKGKKVLKMGVSGLIKKSDAVMKKIHDTFQQALRFSGLGRRTMLNGRMLSIIRHLKVQETTTYKETAKALGVSERSIRYDIERINDALSLERLPLVEKHSKGVLKFPEGLDFKELEEESEVVYTSKERMSVLLLILLLRNDQLKLGRLSGQFRVSRSTVKNDMAALDEKLRLDGLSIRYTDHFCLAGSRSKRIMLLNQEFKKYINYLINPFTNYNSYEFYCIHIIHLAFEGVSIPNVVMAVDKLLDDLGCTLTNTSYAWYMSSIMVVIWFIIHKKDYPLDISVVPEFDRAQFAAFSERLSGILGMEIAESYIMIMAKLFDFTNKFAGLHGEVDPIYAETVTFSLISVMAQKLGLPFDKDKTLVEGLLNHMIPLIQRINGHVEIRDNMVSLLGAEELKLCGLMKEVCKEVESLKEITNEDEIVYLTVCFMASIKRMKSTPYKRVLLVCGHGYGTTTMLKEALLSEYQIHIMDTIPLYKITAYPDWVGIDYLFSTIHLNNELPRPCIVVNPILQPGDRAVIERLGVPRKTILSSYYAIEKKLSFLDEETRKQVMGVIEKELGYQTAREGAFALLHGKGNQGIKETGLSLLINRQEVPFGEKRVKIIFCLASKDGKEHIPAVVTLMRMVKTTPLIRNLEECKSVEEIYQLILNCEFEAG